MLSRLLQPGTQKLTATFFLVIFGALLVAAFRVFPQGVPLPPVLQLGGKFHPLILHLPIGMLYGAVLLECLTGPLRRHDAAVTLLLWLTLLSSMAAALAGYFLAQPGGYPQEVLRWHLWFGISVPVLTFLTLIAKLHYQQKSPLMSSSLYRAPLFTTAVAVMIAGHFGGSMSHGDILKDVKTFLKKPAASAAVDGGQAADRLAIYDAVIAPLMEAKCVSCHGLEKQKGDLQLHTHEAMLLAGESGKRPTEPGKSAQSESVVRILLPTEHEEHMPPEGKKQVTAEELEVLQWWIDAGASPDLKIGDPTVPTHVKEKIHALLQLPMITGGAQGEAGAAGPAGAPAAAPDMAPVQALEKELGITILPLAQNDPLLSFNCVNVADKFGDAELTKFGPIADRLTELNLGRSKVTDAGLASVSGMKNLKKLHLSNTAITDAGIDALLPLAKLEYLNVFNTKLTDAGLAKLEKLAGLKRLFVWQTGVTKPAAEALHAKLPGLVINLGWDQEVKTVVAPAAAPAAGTPPAPSATSTAPDPEKAVYETLIHPIFAAKCIGCHGEEKSKGKLKMHTFADLMKNGDSGEASVVAGKSADSLIIKRALLPLDEDEHMPPSNKDQLTEKELAILKWWIDGGAKTEVKLKDAGLPDTLK